MIEYLVFSDDGILKCKTSNEEYASVYADAIGGWYVTSKPITVE